MNEAVSVASGGKFKDYENLITRFVSDCKEHSVNEFIKYYCSIDLNNDDTGAITGWDAGGIVVKTDESIVEENGELKEYPGSFTLTNTKSGLTLIWSESENGTVTDAQKKIVQGLYSWWFNGALDLVAESYDMNFKKVGTINTIRLMTEYFWRNYEYVINLYSSYDEEKRLRTLKDNFDAPAFTTSEVALNKDNSVKVPMEVKKLFLYVNEKSFQNFDFENKNGTNDVSEKVYTDRTLAHELTHTLMQAYTRTGHNTLLPSIIMEGTAELTHGGDFRNIENFISVIHSIKSEDTIREILLNGNLERVGKVEK